jgi:hypothetical protein
MHKATRYGLLLALAIPLSVAAVALPRLVRLSDYLEGMFFTAETYGTMVLSFGAALVMGLIDPRKSFLWGLVIGLAPFGYGLFLVFVSGGSIPLVPIALILIVSFFPPVVAASLGQTIRDR